MRFQRGFHALLITSAIVSAGASVAAKSLSAPRYDVQVDVQRDGSVVVTETTEFRFAGGPFTVVFREVPTRRTDGIAEVQAWLDDRPVAPGTRPGEVEVTRHGDRVRVEWHLDNTSDRTRRFTLRYRALAVAERREEADRIAWTVLPRDHDYSIEASRVTVTWPQDVAPLFGPALSRPATPVPADRGAAFDLGRVARDRSLEVSMTFPAGSVTPALARWQQRDVERSAMRGPILEVAAALGLIALAFFAFLWVRTPRAPRETLPEAQEPVPPGARPVAIASALRAHDSGPRRQDATAVLLDLARRGHLRIEEAPRRTRWTSRRFELRRANSTDTPTSHERLLLDAVFTDKGAPSSSAEFTTAARRVTKRWSSFCSQVAAEMATAGLLDPDRVAARRLLRKLAIALLVIGAIAMSVSAIAFADRWGGLVVLPGAAVAAAGFVGILLGQSISPLSDRATREAAQWRVFSDAVRRVAKGSRPLGDAEWTYGMLPYAMAFGVGAALATRLQKEHRPMPAWFQPLPGDDGGGALVAMLSSQAATGHGGSAGAASGAAGGGASGAH